MNTKNLIDLLFETKDKSKKVLFWNDHDWVELEINEVLEFQDRILIGTNIPPEKFEMDYKYER